jgi:hypothetical protein
MKPAKPCPFGKMLLGWLLEENGNCFSKFARDKKEKLYGGDQQVMNEEQ